MNSYKREQKTVASFPLSRILGVVNSDFPEFLHDYILENGSYPSEWTIMRKAIECFDSYTPHASLKNIGILACWSPYYAKASTSFCLTISLSQSHPMYLPNVNPSANECLRLHVNTKKRKVCGEEDFLFAAGGPNMVFDSFFVDSNFGCLHKTILEIADESAKYAISHFQQDKLRRTARNIDELIRLTGREDLVTETLNSFVRMEAMVGFPADGNYVGALLNSVHKNDGRLERIAEAVKRGDRVCPAGMEAFFFEEKRSV